MLIFSRKSYWPGLLLAGVLVMIPVIGGAQTIITVNSLLDESGDPQTRTLRWAIDALNAANDDSTIIRFQLPTPLPANPVIALQSALPTINDKSNWIIDGQINQTSTNITIDGSNVASAPVLQLQGGETTRLKNINIVAAYVGVLVDGGNSGLTLERLDIGATHVGLWLDQVSSGEIERCHIHQVENGSKGQYGVRVDSSNIIIQGTVVHSFEKGIHVEDHLGSYVENGAYWTGAGTSLSAEKSNFIYSNDIGINIISNPDDRHVVNIYNTYLGFSPRSVDVNTGEVLLDNNIEANGIGLFIQGNEGNVNVYDNYFRYQQNGIVVTQADQNAFRRNLFFKAAPIAQNQFIPIDLGVQTASPGNNGKLRPIITSSSIDIPNRQLTLSGSGEAGDILEVFSSDQNGNIVDFLGETTVQGDASWSFNYTFSSTLSECKSHYFACAATTPIDNITDGGRTSAIAYTEALSSYRLVQPEISFSACTDLNVQFTDQSQNAQAGDTYYLRLNGNIVDDGNWPLNGQIDLTQSPYVPSYDEYSLQYEVVANNGPNCTFLKNYTIHLAPELNPTIQAEFDQENKAIITRYTGAVVNNLKPGLAYQWRYRRILQGQTAEVNLGDPVPFQSTTDIQPDTLTELRPGYYEVSLRIGASVAPNAPCREEATAVVDLPLDVVFSADPAACGQNGMARATILTGMPPFSYSLGNAAPQFTGEFSDLPPGNYTLRVQDALGQEISGTVVIADQNPTFSIQVGNGPCAASTAQPVRVRWQTEIAGSEGEAYQYEIIKRQTGATMASGTANYGEQIEVDVDQLRAGDEVQLQLQDPENEGCTVVSDKVLIRAPNFDITLDRADGLYPTCRDGSTTVEVTTSVALDPPLAPAAAPNFAYLLQRASANGNYRDVGDPVLGTTPNQSFTDFTPGRYRISITFDPGGFNCQQYATFRVLPPSELDVPAPVVENISCAGQQDGRATIYPRNGEGPVYYAWLTTGQPTDTLSHGPSVSGLAAGSYLVRVWEDGWCAADIVTHQFTITEPTSLGPVTLASVADQCQLVATLPAGQGTPPYLFSWRNEIGQEVARATDITATGNTVRATADISGGATGTYTVTVEDANGCLATSPEVLLEAPELERTYDLCIRWVSPGIPPAPAEEPTFVRPSIGEVSGRAVAAIEDQMSDCLVEQALSLDAYSDLCYDPDFLADTMTLSYGLAYHHYTLFYYDRAGNLVQTVPPAGVNDSSESREETAQHTMATNYRYNSLGQLQQQSTPDGGTTRYLYNDLNQLRFSQNARQGDPQDLENLELNTQRYSFTKYDDLGRVIEVGESFLPPEITFAESELNTPEVLQDNLDFPEENTRDVTRTVYSDPDPSVSYLGLGNQFQSYLDNRISYAWRANQNGDTVTTYYSYDPHGNVSWMVQDLPEIGRSYIGYEYDLLAGTVKQMNYNEGYLDQFFHRYSYDEDNRITQVETSRDKYIWDRDARYHYYPQGPLRYTVLGEDQVQKVDYTYTIQGWLKGINTPNLTTNAEEGPEPDKAYPQDVYGMALGYYPGDFKHAGAVFDAANAYSLADFSSNRALYNGNIAGWSSKIGFDNPDDPFSNLLTASGYRYDRLNRLLASRFHTFDGTDYNPQPDLATAYSYDPNGNFRTLNRKGLSSLSTLEMDDFTFSYYPNSNQLRQVSDAVVHNDPVDDPYELDIKSGQDSLNYVYDASGNLIEDKQEGLTFNYDVSGKLNEVFPTKKDSLNAEKPLITLSYDGFGNRVSKELLYNEFHNKRIIKTYYEKDLNGNTISTYKKSETTENSFVKSNLLHTNKYLYGLERIGQYNLNIALDSFAITNINNSPDFKRQTSTCFLGISSRSLKNKNYALIDHLGNVRFTIEDQQSISNVNHKTPIIASALSYYPFGMYEPGRIFESNTYMYGFQNQEKDIEIAGVGNYLNFNYRGFYSRIGRFIKVDPMSQKFPSLSPYQFSHNSPISKIEIEGLQGADYRLRMKLKYFSGEDVAQAMKVSDEIREGLLVAAFQTVAGFVPYFGQAIDVYDTHVAFTGGDDTDKLFAILGWVPIGDVFKAGRKLSNRSSNLKSINSKIRRKIPRFFKNLIGKKLQTIQNRAEKMGWTKHPTDSGNGWVYKEGDVERIRYSYKTSEGKYPQDIQGYVRWKNADDQFLDEFGNVVPNPSDLPSWQKMNDAEKKFAKDIFADRTHITLDKLNEKIKKYGGNRGDVRNHNMGRKKNK